MNANNNANNNNGTLPNQKTNPYAQPVWPQQANQRANTLPNKSMMNAPPIPDPDYSLSESDGENENSILLAHNTKMNEHISLAMPSESSGNSNTR